MAKPPANGLLDWFVDGHTALVAALRAAPYRPTTRASPRTDGRQVTADADADLPADCTLRGQAADLYLLLWNRGPVHPPAASGDPAVMELWRERAQIKWL